jgi:hypothetical protein
MNALDNTNYNHLKNAKDYLIKIATAIKQLLPLFKNPIKSLYCEYNRIIKLQYNCKVRMNEGYLINKSLADLRNDISSLIKKSLRLAKTYLPIYFDEVVFPYCRNINMDDDGTIEKFYDSDFKEDQVYSDSKQCNDNDISLSGVLLKIIKCDFGVNMSKINFVVFTVINTNPDTNNPPNPPYININNLNYYYNNIDKNPDEFIAKLKVGQKNIISLINNYDFYNKSSVFLNFLDEMVDYDTRTWGKYDSMVKEATIELATRFINFIKNNNASSLIGTLESTDALKLLTFDKYVCSNTSDMIDELKDPLTRYKTVPIAQTIAFPTDKPDLINKINQVLDTPDGVFTSKYLKYKAKYLKLKEKLKN